MRRVTQCLAQFHDALGQDVIRYCSPGPNGIEKLFARDDFTRGTGEPFQHGHGLWFDMHDPAIALQTIAPRPDEPITKLEVSPHDCNS